MKSRREYLKELPEDIQAEVLTELSSVLERHRYLKELPADIQAEVLTELSSVLERHRKTGLADASNTLELDYLDVEVDRTSTLRGTFIFCDTVKGYDYWAGIDTKYFK